MRLSVRRMTFSATSTIGTLSVDGAFECFTLEDCVREIEGQPVDKWKSKGVTAIPRGIYGVVITRSARFGRELPLLVNVPGFEGVRIHPGNTDKDTEGCILVGQSKSGDFIGGSRAAMNKLFPKIQAALSRAEKVEIEII